MSDSHITSPFCLSLIFLLLSRLQNAAVRTRHIFSKTPLIFCRVLFEGEVFFFTINNWNNTLTGKHRENIDLLFNVDISVHFVFP